MGRDGIARAEDNIFMRGCIRWDSPGVGAVTRWVRRAEKSDGWSSKSDGEVKRTRVAANDAQCIAQKSHQRTKLTVIEQRGRISARGSDCSGKIVLAWAIVYDAAQTKRLSNPVA